MKEKKEMRHWESDWNFQTLGIYFPMMEFGYLENFQDDSSRTILGSQFSFRECSELPQSNWFPPVHELIMGQMMSWIGWGCGAWRPPHTSPGVMGIRGYPRACRALEPRFPSALSPSGW